jgi:uncharacterized protein
MNIEKQDETKKIIHETKIYVKKLLQDDSTGHDWWHTYRVSKLATYIAEKEGANIFVVNLAALLHDIDDWKFNATNDHYASGLKAKGWLEQFNLDKKIITHVSEIIDSISFQGAKVPDKVNSLEAMVVQDADRLDAIGAIGIARTFAYGGFKKRLIFDPEQAPTLHNSFAEYKTNKSSTINHFYEKLLLLKDRMNTKTAKEIAKTRHEFMEKFLKQFFEEWEI